MTDPARDCPACPSCGLEMGTPILPARTGVERWDGPEDADLWCPSCGTGWKGTVEDLAQAMKAWIAYEKEMEVAETGAPGASAEVPETAAAGGPGVLDAE